MVTELIGLKKEKSRKAFFFAQKARMGIKRKTWGDEVNVRR